MESFPKSSKKFEDEFKRKLCELVGEWICGTRPHAQVWKRWETENYMAPRRFNPVDEPTEQVTSKTARMKLTIDEGDMWCRDPW